MCAHSIFLPGEDKGEQQRGKQPRKLKSNNNCFLMSLHSEETEWACMTEDSYCCHDIFGLQSCSHTVMQTEI